MDQSASQHCELLSLQHGVMELSVNRFEILQSEEFIQQLTAYMFRLYRLQQFEVVGRILGKLGSCSVGHIDVNVRERSMVVLVNFAQLTCDDEHAVFVPFYSRIFANWLVSEPSYHHGFDFICHQLIDLTKQLLRLQLWQMAQKMVLLIYQIRFGYLPKKQGLRAVICRNYSQLDEGSLLRTIILAYLHGDEETRDVTACIIIHLSDLTSSYLLSELFGSHNQADRLSLLDIIPNEPQNTLPILMQYLLEKQPWYVVRNGILLIGRLQDPDCFRLIQPFILHPDKRIQLQVIDSVESLGGDIAQERIVELTALCSVRT